MFVFFFFFCVFFVVFCGFVFCCSFVVLLVFLLYFLFCIFFFKEKGANEVGTGLRTGALPIYCQGVNLWGALEEKGA